MPFPQSAAPRPALRSALLAILFPAALGADPARLRIDHVAFCGSALAPMEQAFVEAGLAADYAGPVATGDVHSATLGFSDGSFIELIAPHGSKPPAHAPWRKGKTADAGPCSWATPSADIERDVLRFRSLRLRTGKPESVGRTNTDGTTARWRTAAVGPAPPGSTLPLLIEDQTPRESRIRPSAAAAASGLDGIDAVVVVVKHLDRAVKLFRRVYGWEAPETRRDDFFGATLASFPGQPVVLAAPLPTRGSWAVFRRTRFGDGPAAVVLATRDLDAAVRRLGLTGEERWFGKRIAWFPPTRLRGVRVGVAGP